MGPLPRGATAPPMETRSFIRVTMAPRQPSPTSLRRSESGTADVGEVDLVELGVAGHLAQRPDLDAGGVHVDHEVGEALVLLGLGIGAGEDHAEAGGVGQGRPDLLAVEDPLVAVALGPGRQAGHVGSGAGLGEQLAPDLLAGEQRAQVALLLALRIPWSGWSAPPCRSRWGCAAEHRARPPGASRSATIGCSWRDSPRPP